MSFILEALKKSDAERKRGEVPTLADAPRAPNTSVSGSGRPTALIVGALVLAVALAGAGAWWTLSTPTPTQPAPTQPAPVAQVQAEPAPKPASPPAPQPALEPVPEQISQPVQELNAPPLPLPETVPVLQAKPAPAPKVEDAAPPVKMAPAVPIAAPTTPTVKAAEAAQRLVKAQPHLNTASAYVDRAWTSMDKGLYAQAIADLDRAVSLEPAFADAWFARGWANEKNGNERTAINDYGRAINAQPDHAFALFSRGFLNLYGGNARDAVVDFVRTQGVATDESLRIYSHLWLYLARAEAGQNAQARLKDDANRETLANWPGPLVLHFMGAMNESAVLDSIEQGPADTLKERRATGYYFLGMAHRLSGDTARARAYFEKTLATGAVDFRQYEAAKRELDRLK